MTNKTDKTDNTQIPAPAQVPSDTPLKLTHGDLENLIQACDDAISSWQQNKEENFPLHVAGQDEDEDEEVEEIDKRIKEYEELKSRFKEERKHCGRCRKVAPLFVYSACDCYCEACIDELEALEAQAK